jgi:uncharacterized repeat protein (TIGR03806 family)
MTDAALRRVLALSVLTALLAGCDSGRDSMSNATPPPPPGPTIGLDQRPSNSTCLAPARAISSVSIGVRRVFASLPAFARPVAIMQAPDDDTRWFVVQQGGAVRVFENNAAVTTAPLFIDINDGRLISDGEMGLLGMAFHPDFPADPRVYLSYTNPAPLRLRISEFTTPDGGLTLDPNSERVVLTVNKPPSESNHNGGGIAFGPDGFLYLGMGDGGGGNDQHPPIGNGQRLTTLLGKMIRIDISAGANGMLYGVPADNPFAGNAPCGVDGTGAANCPEIFAWGMRNPWRWSLDRQTATLWVGDVGQNAIEEVSRVELGGNYGWRCFEGTRNTNLCTSLPADALPPVAEYGRSVGVTVTGGYVYRGPDFPALVGQYVFADVGSARLFNIPSDTQPTLTVTGGLDTGLSITSFGEANDGELYAVDYGGGGLYQITGSSTSGGGVATQLSATGCVVTADATQPASGLIPYVPNAAFWSDGATKDRWIALPDGQNITVGADGDWDFPNGTVLVKNFRLGNRLIETRHFMRHPDGVWAGYTYEWNPQQTDATLVTGGKQVMVENQMWIFPSEAQCLQCHTAAAGRSLGLENLQLAHEITYPQTGRTAHQLVTLNAIDVLSPPVANPELLTPYPAPAGSAGTLAERARAYLHTNCSGCHRPGGPTPANVDLRYSVSLDASNTCDVAPLLGDLGIANARLIAPGEAARSVLIARMSRRDANGMPPVGSAQVDNAGAALLMDWVNSLTSCN